MRVDCAVSSFSPTVWNVRMKSQEETSMELGTGIYSGPLHSCQALIRERGGARQRAVRSPGREEREEQRAHEVSQSPCRRTFLKLRQALPGRCRVESKIVTSPVSGKGSASEQRRKAGE